MNDFQAVFDDFAREKGLTPDPEQAEAVALLDGLYTALTTPPKKRWFGKTKKPKSLYFYGGVGRGKTMLMDLFFQSVPIHEKRRVHFNIFMLDVHETLHLLREGGRGKDPLPIIAKDIAAACRLLCFDEFQVYDIADAMILAELFSNLFKLGVTVIATSNVAPKDLYKGGLQRARFLPFIDIVNAEMTVFHLDNKTDYRQQSLRDNGTYFIQREAEMKRLFDRITLAEDISPAVIDLGSDSRSIALAKATAHIGWIEFSELCEKPRAAGDYKALVDQYQIIFLNNVPRMGYDRRNEAKRFILLIDTLYDAGAQLVINAETTPEKLYHGDHHAFEFQRTISRLLEMQGREL